MTMNVNLQGIFEIKRVSEVEAKEVDGTIETPGVSADRDKSVAQVIQISPRIMKTYFYDYCLITRVEFVKDLSVYLRHNKTSGLF